MSEFGSDLIVDWLRRAGVDYVSLNPGATLRGIHDSLVRAGEPRMVVALHEEIAVAIAHGYAKAAGKPMAVLLHDLVGPLHGAMAMFNAWADGVPMVVMGGSGPRDTERRRPWIDWIHSASTPLLPLREVVKWSAEPASLEALASGLAKGMRLAQAAPAGPVFLAVDVALQEERIDPGRHIPFAPQAPPDPLVCSGEVIAEVAEMLRKARRPAVLIDRPPPGCMADLVALTELLPLAVVELGGRWCFPSGHWADQTGGREAVLAESDFVLLLEPRDVAWALGVTDETVRGTRLLPAEDAAVVSVGVADLRHAGLIDAGTTVGTARRVISEVAPFLASLLRDLRSQPPEGAGDGEARRAELTARHATLRRAGWDEARRAIASGALTGAALAALTWDAIRPYPWVLANGLVGGWPRRLWDIESDGLYLGRAGGGGLGYGLPASVGAALARKETGGLVVDLQADGDLLYTSSALWTAAHHRLPLLVVVHNNRRYGRDEVHQRLVAEHRKREWAAPVEGIHLGDPPVDFAALAQAMGVEGLGPAESPADLQRTLERAVRAVVEERRPVLVDALCDG